MIHYYFGSFGLLESYGDVQLNWNDISDLQSGDYTSYPPLSLLVLLLFRWLSFGNLKMFMIWAGLLEIGLVSLFYFFMKRKGEETNLEIHESSENEKTLPKGLKDKYHFVLLLFNPFWFWHNITSLNHVGYHYTDLFFLYSFVFIIYFYDQKEMGWAYFWLGISISLKWFTLLVLGFYGLQLLMEKNWLELKKFVLIEALIIGAFLVLPLLFIPNYLNLYIYWITGGGTTLGGSVPFYIKILPMAILSLYYITHKLKSQSFIQILGWSLVIMFSFLFWARFYIRYLLGLIGIGHLAQDVQGQTWKLPKTDLKLDAHELTFFYSIIGLLLTLVILFIGIFVELPGLW